MSEIVRRLVERFTAVWWAAQAAPVYWGPAYSHDEQVAGETQIGRFQETVAREAKRLPRTRGERHAAQERILASFRAFARVSLGFGDSHMDALLDQGLPQVGIQFAQTARRFDPQVRGSDIFQAMRNVWTMNCLQMLLGQPIELTPAVFAYSMLYPYTDNYLDDPAISAESKRAFNERFGWCLAGEDIAPANAQEQTIHKLVDMIEGQFPRQDCPQVFESLYAIHRAQCKSVDLLRRQASPYEVDVLGISLEKGGTSVLADGYLVAGTLTEAQAACLFGWGAFLQFGDDLQDVEQDAADGLSTVFSQTAGRWPLDALTDRALQFGREVVKGLGCFSAPTAEPVERLMERSTHQLLVEAAGAAGHLYTADYVRRLEPHSPFRFSFIRERRGQIAGQSAAIMGLVEAFSRFDPGDSPPPFALP